MGWRRYLVQLHQQLHGTEEMTGGQLIIHREGEHKLLSDESVATPECAAGKWVVIKATISSVNLYIMSYVWLNRGLFILFRHVGL